MKSILKGEWNKILMLLQRLHLMEKEERNET